jgi:hypothetical protein
MVESKAIANEEAGAVAPAIPEIQTVSTDQAIDMLPYAAAILEKMDVKQYISGYGEVKSENKTAAGFDLITMLLRNLPKVKADLYAMLAIGTGAAENEIGAQPLSKTISQAKMFFADSGLMSFFKSAM